MTCQNLKANIDILLGHQHLKVISGQIRSLFEYKDKYHKYFSNFIFDEMKLKVFNET